VRCVNVCPGVSSCCDQHRFCSTQPLAFTSARVSLYQPWPAATSILSHVASFTCMPLRDVTSSRGYYRGCFVVRATSPPAKSAPTHVRAPHRHHQGQAKHRPARLWQPTRPFQTRVLQRRHLAMSAHHVTAGQWVREGSCGW
jgi:hypothetical protein